MEGAFPVQPSHQPAGDYPILEAQHGKERAQFDSVYYTVSICWCVHVCVCGREQ